VAGCPSLARLPGSSSATGLRHGFPHSGEALAASKTVTKATDLLVVGQQDLDRLAGHTESAKMRKAAEMAADGHPIEIIGEDDFAELLSS
jgi:hypothetical protein